MKYRVLHVERILDMLRGKPQSDGRVRDSCVRLYELIPQ